MDVNRIWILIGKKLNSEASQQELSELDSLLSGRIDNTYPVRELEELWRSGDKLPSEMNDPIIKQGWEKLKSRLPENNFMGDPEVQASKIKRFPVASWLAAASIVLVSVCSIWFFIYERYQQEEAITTMIKAPIGSISEVKLPDGSRVWLNAGSKLTYKSHFGDKLREVFLTGEGYFDVVKDASHPFIVNTASLRLKVLGTAFNVKSFVSDKTSEASLIHGSIEVTVLNNPDKKFILKPSEKIVVRNDQTISKASPAHKTLKIEELPLITLGNIHYQETDSLPSEAQWMEKKLAFTSERFEDLAADMERFYNVRISFQNEQVKRMVFSGSFKQETVHEAMEFLQFTVSGSFKYKIQQNQITIYN